MTDVVLSSGYLAFARQAGFLAAVEAAGIPVDGVCGTSSGALAGALWASGRSAGQVAAELGRQRPIDVLQPNWRFWDGWAAFRLDKTIARLRELLPPRFEDLPRPFAVGVMTLDRRPVLLTSGPLPEAVAASCAIPRLFAPIRIGESLYADGGLVDRTAIDAWRGFRGPRPTIVHVVHRSRGGNEGNLGDLPVVRTPSARASLWHLGDFEAELTEARGIAERALTALTDRSPSRSA